MKLFRTMAMLVAAIGITTTTAAPAMADTGVIATYHGKRIDLSKGWQGAQACAEFAVGDVRCYDTAAEADTATRPAGEVAAKGMWDCPGTWVCLWQDKNYTGRRLQWSAAGTKKLADWDFRDKTTSVFLNRVQRGMEAVNYRTLGLDDHSFYCASCAYDNLAASGWNDKIDEVKI